MMKKLFDKLDHKERISLLSFIGWSIIGTGIGLAALVGVGAALLIGDAACLMVEGWGHDVKC